MRNDGMAEKATSHLHPKVGMTREAIEISNRVPTAHATYNSKMTDSTYPAKKICTKVHYRYIPCDMYIVILTA